MRTAFGLRLLLALTLMGWGQFVFAEPYTFRIDIDGGFQSSSALSVCKAWSDNWGARLGGRQTTVRVYEDPSRGLVCGVTFNPAPPYGEQTADISRSGDSCQNPTDIYNPANGQCAPNPAACEPLKEQRFSFFANVPNGGTSLPGEYICNQGCRAAWSGECGTNDQGVSACWGLATYNGQICESGDTPSGIGTPPKDPNEPTDPTDPTEPPTCGPGYSWSGTTCVKDPPKACDPSTGEVCPPTDPTDPTNPTDPTDPDNPGDGGDGDGDGSGDGDGDTGSGEPGEGEKEKLGPKIDKTNSLLDGISKALGNLGDAFKEFAEDALGEKYDGEGDGDDKSIGDAAAGLAGSLAGNFGQGLNDSLEEQEALNQGTLADLPNLVGNEWFGPGSVAYSTIFMIDKVLPRAGSCSAFDVKVDAGKLHTNLRLNACELSRIKPLLEWIVWMGTIIGVWRIAYAGLRLENAKAEKGGF